MNEWDGINGNGFESYVQKGVEWEYEYEVFDDSRHFVPSKLLKNVNEIGSSGIKIRLSVSKQLFGASNQFYTSSVPRFGALNRFCTFSNLFFFRFFTFY